MKRLFPRILLLCLGLGVYLCACTTAPAVKLHGGVMEPPKAAPDFSLTDFNGNAFTLSSLRGQVTLLYFGYTSCPDICPMTLVDLAAVRQKMGSAGKDVRVVFVTVDPERDTAQVLQRYVPAFDPDFVGLRGTLDETKTIAASFGAKFIKTSLPNSALGYAVDHSAFIYVIDRKGLLREMFPFGAERQDILDDLQVLVKEGPVG